MYLLPPSGTRHLTAFVSVNLEQLSGNTLKLFLFSGGILGRPLATHYPSASDSILDFWRSIIHLLTYLLTYLLTCFIPLHFTQHGHDGLMVYNDNNNNNNKNN